MTIPDTTPLPDDGLLRGEWAATAAQRGDATVRQASAGSTALPSKVDLLTTLQARDPGSERLPMLEVVFDRLERMLGESMRRCLGDNVEIKLESVTTQRFGEHGGQGPLPAMVSVFKAVEWGGHGLLTLDGQLIYSIVDVLLGSRRNLSPVRVEGRPYTSIETALVERVVRLVLPDLARAFAPITPVEFRLDRIETNPRFAAVARPGDACVVGKIRVELEDRGGTLLVALPHATLEPVRDRLLQTFMGEKLGRDTIWEHHLAREVWQAGIELEAVLEERTARLGDVMGLKVGSVLKLGVKPDEPVILQAGGVPMMIGRVARRGDTIVVQVEQRTERAREAER